jgi:MFS transporter, PPP family, 3-phenylpropionic acid transporter
MASVLTRRWLFSAGSSLGVRISLFFGALFVILGLVLPYFPVWLHSRGLSPIEISIITAAPLFARVAFTPAMGFVADHLGNYRLVIITLAWSALALAVVVSGLSGFWPILTVGVMLLLAISTLIPLTETVAVSAVRSDGLDYGRMRLWGSITFIIANFAGGVVIEILGGGSGIWLIASAILLTAASAYWLPAPVRGAVPTVRPPRAHWRMSLPVRLLRSHLFAVFLVAIGCIHGAHATFYTFGALHWQAQGLSAAWVGTLWAIGVIAEVLLFAFSAPVVRRFSPVALIVAGAAASVLRWSVMGFDPPLGVLLPLQVLHGLTYGAAHIGAIHFISRAVPPRAIGSAQSFYAVIAAGLFQGVIGLASGALYARLGGAVYFLAAGVSVVGLVTGVMLLRRWDGGLLWPEALSAPASPIALPKPG